MTDFDDNQFDDFEELLDEEDEEITGQRKPGNRKSVIAVGALGAVLLIIVIGLFVFASLIEPQRKAAEQTEIANNNAQNTVAANDATVQAVARAAQETLESAASPTFTHEPILTSTFIEDQREVTITAEPTEINLMVLPTATSIPTATVNPLESVSGEPEALTATVSALLTSVAGGDQAQATSAGLITQNEAMTSTAQAIGTATQSAASSLPDTGIADDLGLPGMLAAAAVLIGIILIVRRLRFAH